MNRRNRVLGLGSAYKCLMYIVIYTLFYIIGFKGWSVGHQVKEVPISGKLLMENIYYVRPTAES